MSTKALNYKNNSGKQQVKNWNWTMSHHYIVKYHWMWHKITTFQPIHCYNDFSPFTMLARRAWGLDFWPSSPFSSLPSCDMTKGETITRVNGNVSFFAGKRLQNSYTCKRSQLIIACKWECIIVKGGENYHFLCAITLYQLSIYKMDKCHCILLLVFKYVRRNQWSVYGIFFLMLFIQNQLFAL